MVKAEALAMVELGKSHGLVTRAQALRFLTARQVRTRVETGAWLAVFPRVYRVVGAPETWLQRVDGLLLWKTGVVLSHRTAAALHQLRGFPEGPLDITSTGKVRAPPGVTVYRVDALLKSDRAELDERPVTSVARTLFDLAALTDRSTLRTAVDQALREKKTTLEKMAAIVGRSDKRPGIIDARKVLTEFQGSDGPTDSELERCALELIESAGLPTPKVQSKLIIGTKRRRLDLLFKELGVVIEVDGYAWHSGVDHFEADRARNNSLAVSGFLVLHWTWSGMQDRPEELIVELYAALNRRR